MSQETVRPRPWLLLVLLTLAWGVGWPAIKVGVSAVPPIWYACLRYLIATVCLAGIAGRRDGLAWPSPRDRRLVGVSGTLQMAAYSALTGLALTRLPPGRASVLAFSTPIWVVPLAAVRLRERISRRALVGVGLGLAGVLAIAAPALRAEGRGSGLAYVLLLGASAAWAVSIVYVREHRFAAPALALAPWQTLLAALLLGPLAWLVEGRLPPVGWPGIASLAYVGPVATAFAYWAVVEAGRHYPASTLATALLATPAVGLVISALALGEALDAPLLLGLVLVAAGIRLATMSSRAERGTRCPGLDPEHNRRNASTIEVRAPTHLAPCSLLSAESRLGMTTHLASIERSNRKDISNVQVEITVTDLSSGRQTWAGKFVSRSADGILPNERLALSFETGQKGTARVSQTEFDSRKPDTTLVHFTGTSPLV